MASRSFQLARGARPLSAVVEALAVELDLREEARGALSRVHLDTFDWRLWRRGWTLVEEPAVEGRRLRLSALRSARELALCDAPLGARFAWDLPPSRLRTLVEPVVEMRALAPIVRLSGQQIRLARVDREGKIVARLTVEEARLSGRRRASLGTFVHLRPLRGYAAEARELEAALAARSDVAAPGTVFAAALERLGARPGAYSSKIAVALEPDTRADVALRRVLAGLLATFEANLEGTIDDLDSEHLHDLRVSVRRMRVAIGRVKGVLPARIVERWSRELKWLGQVTGPTRDLDVYLLELPRYRALLSPAMAADLAPLRAWLVAEQRRAQSALARELRGERVRRIRAGLAALVAEVPARRPSSPNATRPIGEVAGEVVWKEHRRVRRQARAVRPDSAAELLHELRKSCKKLRYAMEFFRSLYPTDAMERSIGALKALQQTLGACNDYEIQKVTLRQHAARLEREHVGAGTLLAIGALIDRLDGQHRAARAELDRQLAAFDDPDNRALARSLFRAEAGA